MALTTAGSHRRPALSALTATSRALAAILGGYALTQAFTVALSLGLQRGAQWARGEAIVTAAMLAFVAYLLAALRAFVAATVWRAWGELLAAAALLVALSWIWG